MIGDGRTSNGSRKKKVEFDRPSLIESPRSHFNEKDWARLTRFLREWPKGAAMMRSLVMSLSDRARRKL